MQPWSAQWVGKLDEHLVTSEALRDNPLGDPHERPLWVYTPPGYADRKEQYYPSVYVIQGYTGFVTMWSNRKPFRQPFPDAVDELFATEAAPPAIVVFVDAWTAYGGSQFVDSPGTGRYHTYLCDEIVPFVDARYRTLDAAAHRGIMGKSSGGFGAMITPMLRPDLFGGLATHAGDALYEYLYLPEFSKCVRLLRDYAGDMDRWWRDFRQRVAFTRDGDDTLLMTLGCTAAFSAAADGRPLLPFDPRTGVLTPDLWQRWLDWDPVRMVPKYAAALHSVRAFWIDGGTKDEWNLDIGADAFRQALLDIDVPQDRIIFELFDAGHGGIDYRYPLSLRYLANALSPKGS